MLDHPEGGSAPVAANVTLRPVTAADLDFLYDLQSDPVGAAQAVFTPRTREAFDAHWARILADPAVLSRMVVADGETVGNVVSWDHDGRRDVGYWIARERWGRGIASAALRAYLDVETVRPLWADPFASNTASVALLRRCGFREVRRESGPDGEQIVLVKDD